MTTAPANTAPAINGIDETVKPGYDAIKYTVRLKGDGTPEQFQKMHEVVRRTSPNRASTSPTPSAWTRSW